jgi:hypothetical protein
MKKGKAADEPAATGAAAAVGNVPVATPAAKV